MKTISIDEFITLVARNDWHREQEYGVIESLYRQDDQWDKDNDTLEIVDVLYFCGWVSKASILDGIRITYTEGFKYDELDLSSLSTSTEGMSEIWSVEGILVIDEDGDELSSHDLADYLSEDFGGIDYRELLAGITNEDMEKEDKAQAATFSPPKNAS